MPPTSLCKAPSQMRFPGDWEGPLGKKQAGVPQPSGTSSPASSLRPTPGHLRFVQTELFVPKISFSLHFSFKGCVYCENEGEDSLCVAYEEDTSTLGLSGMPDTKGEEIGPLRGPETTGGRSPPAQGDSAASDVCQTELWGGEGSRLCLQ